MLVLQITSEIVIIVFKSLRVQTKRTPKEGGGGGKKNGGAKPHEKIPRGKPFPTPLTSVRSPKSPEFASGDDLRNHFRRVSKNDFHERRDRFILSKNSRVLDAKLTNLG